MLSNNLVRLFVLLLFGLGNTAHAESPSLMSYQMEDQFGRVHSDEDVRGHVVVLTGSDKRGSTFNPLWIEAISEDLNRDVDIDSVRLITIANLRAVPFFLKGMIKKNFPQEPEKWVLLDWEGLFAKTYAFQPKASNTLVFSPTGDLLLKTHGREVEAEKLAVIVARIRAALAEQAEVPEDP